MLKQQLCPPSYAVSQKNRSAVGGSYSSMFARFTYCLTSIPGARQFIYSVRLINVSLPGNGFIPSCLTHGSMHLKHLLNMLRGLNKNLIFLAKQWCVQQANRITCFNLILARLLSLRQLANPRSSMTSQDLGC